MPVPREVLFDEEAAAWLAAAVLRLTGHAALTHRAGDVFVVATDRLDAHELGELRFAIDFVRQYQRPQSNRPT